MYMSGSGCLVKCTFTFAIEKAVWLKIKTFKNNVASSRTVAFFSARQHVASHVQIARMSRPVKTFSLDRRIIN